MKEPFSSNDELEGVSSRATAITESLVQYELHSVFVLQAAGVAMYV